MKFVYCLATNDDGCFAEMTAVSMTTLRAVMPGANIVILTDSRTAALTTPAARIMRDLCDEWLVDPACDALDPIAASRLLGLSARARVSGRIVLIDGDMLIARPLDALSRTTRPIAATPDVEATRTHRPGTRHPVLGWELPHPLFNAGLVVCRDCEETTQVYQLAGKLLTEAFALGVPNEQIALNVAAMRLGVEVETLPHHYNAQISIKADAAVKPAVFHLFSAQVTPGADNVLAALTFELKRTGALNRRLMERFLATGNPWTRITRPRQYLALGRPAAAAMLWARRLAGFGPGAARASRT